MLSFFKPRSRRIFLVNLEGLSVFAIQDDQLTHVARFSDEDTGHENFGRYLAENPPTPVTIVLDSIAEDFLVEEIPHVSPFDRASLLKRKAGQHFRGVDYQSAKVLGRSPANRKSDRVLFSAITKNQTLEPWVKTMLQEEVPIRSITTPAYALCRIAEDFGLLEEERVLLVNWEVSGIRHTYIENGRTLFSRLTPRPSSDEGDLAEAIIDSCNQSNDYLERIGLIGFEQSMDVHVITPQLPDDIFSETPSTRNFRRIVHHNSIDMADTEQFHGAETSITANILALDWGVRKGELANIYAPSAALRFQELFTARRLIYITAVVTLLFGGLTATPLLLDALERELRIVNLNSEAVPVQQQYDALTAQFPETPIPSEALEVAVSSFSRINSQLENPNQMLVSLSQVMAQFPGVNLTSIEWRLGAELNDDAPTQLLLTNRAIVVMDVYGTLSGSNSIGNSDRELRRFVAALDALDDVSARAIAMPIEEGPEGEVNTVINDTVVDVEFGVRMGRES